MKRRTSMFVIALAVASVSLASSGAMAGAWSLAVGARQATDPQTTRGGSVQTASPGTQLWVRRYDGPGEGMDTASSLGVGPGGNRVYVTGWSKGGRTSGYSADYATVAYKTSNGRKLWAKRFNDPWNGDDAARALGVSPDGSRVFVTGQSPADASDTNDEFATVAYDAPTGRKIWTSRYDGPGSGEMTANLPTGLAVSPDGNTVFVTGSSGDPSTGAGDFATIAYDASSGHQLWVSRYAGPSDGGASPSALALSPDGRTVFVAGSSREPGSDSNDFAIVAYDASSGTELWASGYDDPENGPDAAHALGVSPDGSRVFVTGTSAGPSSTYGYATVAFDASSGQRLWVSRYDAPRTGKAEDSPSAIGVNLEGTEVFVTGSSRGGSAQYSDYATVAYAASTGKELWVSRFDRPNRTERATGLVVSPTEHRVFVTGYSRRHATRDDYATVAYKASTGRKLWVRRYDGPKDHDDVPIGLAVSPNGTSVFVTGSSPGLRTGIDYATLAYRAG